MTIDKCDPCGCIPGYISTSKFYQDVETIACSILDALTGGGGGEIVQVVSVIPGTGQLNLGKAHNAAFVAGGTGVMGLGVRNDTAATDINALNQGYGTFAVDVKGKLFIKTVDTVTTVAALTAITNALPAGANILGKVGIDQTTPGTTNGVVVNSGTLTTVGTVTSVTTVAALTAITNALPAGTNLLGKVGIDQTTPGTTNGIVQNIKQTLVSKGGSVASSGDNTLVTAGTNKLKVYAFSLSTNSTVEVVCKFESGAGGTVLWEVTLQAVTGATAGANLAVAAPAWLFNTASATLLNLNLSTNQTVHYSVSYFDEA